MTSAFAIAGALAILAPTAASPSTDTTAHAPARAFQGRAVRAGDRAPIAGAIVLMIREPDDRSPGVADASTADPDPPALARAETDEDGRFELGEEIEGPRARVVIIASGYERLDYVIARDREGAKTRPTRFFLQPDGDDPYRTVVRDQSPPEDEGGFQRRTLRDEEIETVPGAWGDPLLALQNMPGFFRSPAGIGALSIRGGVPGTSATFIGEHPVPRVFHVLPLTSVVPAPFVKRIDYEAGNFGARYGDAVAGMVHVEPRAGDTSGVHGHAQLSVVSVGASVEGPVGPGSFLLAARRGYTDAVIGIANRVGGGQFSLPSYYDYQALYDMPLRAGGSLGVHVIGSGDAVRLSTEEFPEHDGRVFRSDFHRLDMVYRRAFGPYEVLLSPAFRYDISADEPISYREGEDGFFVPVMEEVKRRDYNVLLRAELRRQWTPRLKTTLGTDARLDPYVVSRVSSYAGAAPPVRGRIGDIGLYAQATFDLGPLRVIPATRLSGFFLGSRAGFAADPRFTIRGRVGERWTLTAAIGQYSRSRYGFETSNLAVLPSGSTPFDSDVPGLGNLSLPSSYYRIIEPTLALAPREETFFVQHALQTSAGVAYEPARGWSIELVGFTRAIRALVEGDPSVEHYWAPTYGAELMIRRALTRKLYGWLSYTLLWSEQVFKSQLDGSIERHPTGFEQRHNLNLVLSYQLPKRWRIGGRLRLSSGVPYTPIVGSREVDGRFVPILGKWHSARYPWFHQLDIRVDKRWVLKRVSVSMFLDIQNVYGGNAVDLYIYSPDYRAREGMAALPILPVIGLQVNY